MSFTLTFLWVGMFNDALEYVAQIFLNQLGFCGERFVQSMSEEPQ
jgi:hypothetical protein